MASNGAEDAGAYATPVFTENRIEALRNHLRVLVKALKVAYCEATTAESTQQRREDANLLVASFTKTLEEVEDEYRKSVVTTDNVRFAADSLLSELQVYRAVLGERFPPLSTTAPLDGADATNERERGNGRGVCNGAGNRRRSTLVDGKGRSGDGAGCSRRKNERALRASPAPTSNTKDAKNAGEDVRNGADVSTRAATEHFDDFYGSVDGRRRRKI